MNLFDLNNDILIKIEEEVAIKRKHKLFLSNLINHRDQFYTNYVMMWFDFDMDCFEDHLNFRNGYWYQRKYFVMAEDCRKTSKYSYYVDRSRIKRMPEDEG